MPTPNTGIPYVPENTLNPAAGLNLALSVIDALLQTRVISMALTAPPGSPSDGALYIPASPATGAWAGLEDWLVRYVAEGDFWQSYEPGVQVHLVLNADDGGLYAWSDGSPGSWQSAFAQPGAPVVTESTDTRVASPSDAGDYTRFTYAGAKTYEFDGSESWVVGTEFHGRNAGSGALTIVESSSMVINPPFGGSLDVPEDGTFTIKIVGAAEADLFGVTEPSGSP